ncbi:MAG: thioesterase domain-containing protein, partial [Gammaproteobacteria bacterium]
GTSIQAAIAFTEIERRLGRDLPLSILFAAGNVRALLEVLDEPAEQDSPLVTIQRLGKRPPVLACPGIGGNVVGMAGIARALGDAQPFFGLQQAGVFDADADAMTVPELASAYMSASESVRAGPVVLLGICFGANVVLDMARQLTEQGQPPALVIVMDPVYDDAARPTGPDPSLRGFLRDRLRLYAENYRSLQPAERREWLRDKRRALWNKVWQGDLLRGNRFEIRQRRVEAANIAAARDYYPRRYEGQTRILLTADRVLDLAEDPRQRWVMMVAPDAEVAMVPGIDTGDALARHAPVVADRLRRWIDEFA